MQARVALMFEHREALEHELAVKLTAHRLVVIALAHSRALSAADLASGVQALEPSPLFEQVRRLRHQDAAYRYLCQLEKIGLMRRAMRGETRVFRLRRGLRTRIGAILGQATTKPLGRRRTNPLRKARAITITLWPDEFQRLESLRASVSRDLPADVTRSDLLRVGLDLLAPMTPDHVLRHLVKLRKARDS